MKQCEKVKSRLFYFADEAWLHLNEQVNAQNNRYFSADNPRLIHQVPLHEVKLRYGMLCVRQEQLDPASFHQTQ